MIADDRSAPPGRDEPTSYPREATGATAAPQVKLHVEILDRRGRVLSRARIDALPCVIGRGYACGVVLDDRFVSPQHVQVRLDGAGNAIVEDLSSTNGLYDMRSGAPATTVAITAGTTIRIGQSLLRFHTADEPVAPAVPLPAGFSTPRWTMPLAFALAFGFGSLSWYLESYAKITASPFVWGGVFLAVIAFWWAGAWSMMSRILLHQSHFAEHYVIVCCFVPVYILAGWVTDYYAFAFGADRSAALLDWFLPTFVTAGLLYNHLRFCSVQPQSRLLLRAAGFAGVATVLAGLLAFTESLDPNWTAALSFRGELKPPVFRLVSSDDIEGFFTRVEALQARVDELAAEDGDH